MPGGKRTAVAPLVLLTVLAGLSSCGALAATMISACVQDGGGFSLSDVTVNVYDPSGTLLGNGTTSPTGCVNVDAGSSPGPFFARTQNSRGYTDELYNSQPCEGSCDVTRGEPISPASPFIGFQLAFSTLRYNGGPVIHSPNVYYIFYGDWSRYGTASAILEDFAGHIGGSAYFGSNTTFYDTNEPNNQRLPIFNSATYKGAIFDSSYSQGNVLNGDSVANIIGSALSAGSLPADTSGVYFVLSSPDVNGLTRNGSAFCTQMCGWHDYLSGGGHTFAAAWIGHPYHCTASGLYGCGGVGNTLNGDAGADAMVNVVAHELNESVTDPMVGSGWYSPAPGESGDTEVGDRCVSFSGLTYPARATGLPANVHFGSRDYLIQGTLVNDPSGDYCAIGNESIRGALKANGKPTPLSERCGAVTAMARYNGGLLVALDDHLCGADGNSVEWFPDPLGKGTTIKSGRCSPVTAMTAYSGGLLVAYSNVGCTANYSRIAWLAHPDQTFDGGTDVRGTSCAGVTAIEVYNPPAQAGPGGLLVALDNSAPCAAGGQSVEWYRNPLSGNGAAVVNAGGCSALTALAGHDGGVLAAFNSVGCQSGQNGIQFLPRPDQSLSGTPVSDLGISSVKALVPYGRGVLVAYTGLGGGTQADQPQNAVQWAADALNIRGLKNVFQGGAEISALAAVDGGLMAALGVPGTAEMIFLASPIGSPPTTWELSVSVLAGQGRITSNNGTIACPGMCVASFEAGATVALNATPATGSVFSGWSGACTGLTMCSVTMNADETVGATFAAGPPAAPSKLSATALSPRQVRLQWQDNANGKASFHIEMRVGSAFQEVGVASATTSSWVKKGLRPHTRYVFRVRAENTVGFSAYSNRAPVVTP